MPANLIISAALVWPRKKYPPVHEKMSTQVHYMPGKTPLVGWIKGYMVPELLAIDVCQVKSHNWPKLVTTGQNRPKLVLTNRNWPAE